MRSQISHITKLKFLPVFKRAYKAAITSKNIQEGFQGARLALFNLEQVISTLNIKLHTPSPPLTNKQP
jgi:hypothetical protein